MKTKLDEVHSRIDTLEPQIVEIWDEEVFDDYHNYWDR